jgi:hypothetical protein
MEETDTDSEEPDFSWEEDFSEEESLSEEEPSREEYIKATWAAIEEPVTLQWPAEPEETEEAEEVIFYDESGEEIDYFVEVTFGEDSGLPADVTLEVSEIKAGTKEYEAYHKSSLEAVKKKAAKRQTLHQLYQIHEDDFEFSLYLRDFLRAVSTVQQTLFI